MRLTQVGFIFSILMLISILGVAAENGEKSNGKKSLTHSNGAMNTNSQINSNRLPAAASTAPATTANNTSTKGSSSSAAEDLRVEETEKGETLSVAEEAPSVKGVKKRGSSLNDSNNAPSSSPSSLFDDEKGFLAGLDYPELQVVPRASERLQMEALDEKNSLVGSYWPIQISAIALMVAGANSSGKYAQENPSDSQKSENQFAAQMGVLVGAMWLGGTYYLNHTLSYSKALPEIKKINGKDKKSLLLKERLSEEALERPAKVARTLTNLSISTNFVLALYIASHSKQTRPSYAGWAMGLAFLPMFIENHIVENWEKHQEYKRKIYAPITRVDFTIDPTTQRLTPLLGMRWQF